MSLSCGERQYPINLFFATVCLGDKYERLFLEAIKNGTIPDFVEVIIGLHINRDATGIRNINNPVRKRIEGVTFYSFWFYGFNINIKVDKQESPLSEISIRENKDIIVLDLGDYNDSDYKKALIKILKQRNNKLISNNLLQNSLSTQNHATSKGSKSV